MTAQGNGLLVSGFCLVDTDRVEIGAPDIVGCGERHHATRSQLWEDCLRGNMPVQECGARLVLRDDDGSGGFAELHARASEAPVFEKG